MATNISVHFVPDTVNLGVGYNQTVNLTANKELVEDAWINFTYETSNGALTGRNLINPIDSILWHANTTFVTFMLTAISGGHIFVGLESNSSQFIDLAKTYLTLNTFHVSWLQAFSDVIGWIYFSAWTISFWPQVFLNFYRKSVVGLNFDFLTYNIIGFACYASYNCALFFSPVVQKEYKDQNPKGGLPVTLQDVCFALHAVAVVLLTIVQCLIFERGNQKVSKVCMGLSGIAILFIIVVVAIGAFDVITWLLVIQCLSYVKLGSTIIKYMPQAYMNFRRQSTIGWSIWNVLLDFTGGISSLTQMMVLAYNYDDWASILGNPTKFALGAFSVLFDILFIVQHYCLYYDARDDVEGADAQSFTDDHHERLRSLLCCCGEKKGPPLVPHNPSSSSFGSNTYSQIVNDNPN